MYIVLEGIVGTGKSTQGERLAEYLQNFFPDTEVLLTREPGGTEIAEAIRILVQGTDFVEVMDPLTEAYLYASARAQLIATCIKPVLDRWWIVVSDRNFVSSVVIQGVTKWLGIDLILEVNKSALQGIWPDLILFFDLDVATGIRRTFDSDGDKHEREWREFYEKQYEAYHRLGQHPLFEKVWEVIDARGSVDEVWERVKMRVRERIRIRDRIEKQNWETEWENN